MTHDAASFMSPAALVKDCREVQAEYKDSRIILAMMGVRECITDELGAFNQTHEHYS